MEEKSFIKNLWIGAGYICIVVDFQVNDSFLEKNNININDDRVETFVMARLTHNGTFVDAVLDETFNNFSSESYPLEKEDQIYIYNRLMREEELIKKLLFEAAQKLKEDIDNF